MSAVKKELNIANKSVKQAGKMLDKWVKKYGHLCDPVGVLEHGRKCILPGHKKYKEQFIDPGGRCKKIRKASLACQIFDPFVQHLTRLFDQFFCDVQLFFYRGHLPLKRGVPRYCSK